MKQETFSKLSSFFKSNPKAQGLPSKLNEIDEAQEELNIKFPDAYIAFLLKFGGCLVGSSEIYGLVNSELMDNSTVIELNKSFNDDDSTIPDNWLVIGTNASRNPIMIDDSGRVVMEDRDFDERIVLAHSFEKYILKSLDGDI